MPDDEKEIDVWVVDPHYMTEFDILLTDDPEFVPEAVGNVVESAMHSGSDDFSIRVKQVQMTRQEFDDKTTA